VVVVVCGGGLVAGGVLLPGVRTLVQFCECRGHFRFCVGRRGGRGVWSGLRGWGAWRL
jgi:hypothetical protein